MRAFNNVWAQVRMLLLMLRPVRLFSALFQMPWYRHILLDAVLPARWSGRTVLELGSASGELSRVLAQAGARVLAVDHSATMVRAAATQDPGVRTLCADALALPMADKTFDLCLAASLLNVVPDPGQLLQEMVRVTRSGGEVMVLFPVQGFTVKQAHDWLLSQRLQGLERAAYLTWQRMARKLDLGDMQRLLHLSGLEGIRTSTYLGGMVVALHGTVV